MGSLIGSKNTMRKLTCAIGALLLSSSFLHADVAPIGQILLQADTQAGSQDLYFFNATGGFGCAGNTVAPPDQVFSVCNGVNIDSWSLTVDFNSYNNAPVTSPLQLSGTGPLGPGSLTTLAGPGVIPLTQFGPCPPCDAQITQVVFTGTIDGKDTPFFLGDAVGGASPYPNPYNPSDPSTYTVFNAITTFSLVWNVSPSDYTGDPAQLLFDGASVEASDQTLASVPEPSSISLTCVLLFSSFILVTRFNGPNSRKNKAV